MTTRLSRLLCSKTFLLSVLSFLGIFELGRNIFDSIETSPQHSAYNVVQEVATVAAIKLVEDIPEQKRSDTPIIKVTTDKDDTDNVTDKQVVTKNKKYVRQKILLLAYARYYPLSTII